jgi:hypothetical protein
MFITIKPSIFDVVVSALYWSRGRGWNMLMWRLVCRNITQVLYRRCVALSSSPKGCTRAAVRKPGRLAWWSDEGPGVCLRVWIGGGLARVDARRSDRRQVVVRGRISGIVAVIVNEVWMINGHCKFR